MNSLSDYADALQCKARDDGYFVRSMSADAAGEDEPTLQREWAVEAVYRTLDWATE